jgi:hypothetical protein
MPRPTAAEKRRAVSAKSGRRSPFPPDGRFFGIALAVVALLYLTISTMTLLSLGFNYDEAGGNVLEKIHPATFVAVAVLVAALASRGNPLTALIDVAERQPGTALFVLTIALMIAYSVAIVGLPFTGFFDTFLAPVVVFLLFKDMSDARAQRFVWLIHGFMLLNALLGIGEFVTGYRLTPIIANGMVIDDDWRSSALLGHPLANASLTGAYLLAMAVGGAEDLPKPAAALCFVTNAVAMVVFGGRASTVILLALLAALAAKGTVRILHGGKIDKSAVLTVLIIVPIAALAVVTLAEAGFFDRFLERFIDDKGSASTRIEMFELFNHLSWYQLLLAPDAGQLTTLKRIYGLDFGIESFWVSFVLSYGIIPCAAFFAALFLFCRDLLRAVRPGGIWVLTFFFLVASTSVSLSSKTTIFALLVLLMLVMLRRPRLDLARAETASRGEFQSMGVVPGT